MKPSNESAGGERVALFPGSFRPFTAGHASVVERGLALFDRIVIAVEQNFPHRRFNPRLAAFHIQIQPTFYFYGK